MSVEIRSGTQDDLDFMGEMLVEAAYRDAEPRPTVAEALVWERTAAYVERWGRSGDAAVVAVDRESCQRVGAAWYRLFTERAPGYGFVDSLTPEITIAVVPGRRGSGIGSALLAKLLERARSDGFDALSLSVGPENPAVRLYERAGFEPVPSRDEHITMRAVLP